MHTLCQSPTDRAFVQNPYGFYARARAVAPLLLWEDYAMPAAFSYGAVSALFRDSRLGRAAPPECSAPVPPHLAPFYDIEAHSLLELEPPHHTRLRALVLRAFTSRRIRALAPEIAALAHALIDRFPPSGAFDLLPSFATQVPVRIIARLLGVAESMWPQLLDWSHAMVAMYQARRDNQTEERAVTATQAFSAFLRRWIEEKRANPGDDLITHLIAAQAEGDRLSLEEMISTCILLLNAGHEATVHALGNGVKTLLAHENPLALLAPEHVETTTEELLRFDPPLHMFTRYVYQDMTFGEMPLRKNTQVALVLGAANRDESQWPQADRFMPERPIKTHMAFGAGRHFCLGAPLARLEMQIALPILMTRCPTLHLTAPPHYADIYHFHGLERLMVAL
ncbi:MAG: cytochrome P450 [Rhodobacteraceae bacterium]|nr:cytochrome P450 [Paracoccaceae bacterium]